MHRPQCARWVQMSLAVLISSLASAVNAATLDDYPVSVTDWEVPPSVNASDSEEPLTDTSSVRPVSSIETTIELSPEAEPSALEPSNSPTESLESLATDTTETIEGKVKNSATVLTALPIEAVPTTHFLSPGEEFEGDTQSSLKNSEDSIIESSFVTPTEPSDFLSPDALEIENKPSNLSETTISEDPTIAPVDSELPQSLEVKHRNSTEVERTPITEKAIPETNVIPSGVIETSKAFEGILVAQITPDTTLGSERSIVVPDVSINGQLADQIEGGAARSNNLFHSFEEFNVNTGQQVYFANPTGIENILSRVTGSSVSEIDGLLGVDGTANLFLLNPNGVSFGPNARLDISGALAVSTADTLKFEDGSVFSAVNPQEASPLSISVPLGVQRGGIPQGNISSTGVLATGQDLTLFGHEVYVEGQVIAGGNLTLQAQDTVTIRDTATDAFIARSGEALTIRGDQEIDIWTLQHLEQTPFVSGSNLAFISDGVISGDAHFESGGNLQFLTLDGMPGNVVSFYDPIISANGDVVFGNYTGVALKVEATGSIQAGNIVITGPDMMLTADGSGSDEDLLASSRAAILRAGVEAVVKPNLPQTAEGTLFAAGSVAGQPLGSIVVGSINTSNTEGGDGGPIILEASGNIVTTGSFKPIFVHPPVALGTFSYSNSEDAGNGGDILVDADFVDIRLPEDGISTGLNSSSISTGVNSGNSGDGGDISITAHIGDITIINNETSSDFPGIRASSALNSSSNSHEGNSGNGGNISITANMGDITIENNGKASGLNSSSNSEEGNSGNGGNILITANMRDIIIANSGNVSGLNSSSISRGIDSGDGGDISITANRAIDITNNGRVGPNRIDLSGLSSISFSEDGNAGNGGEISINANRGNIKIKNSGEISRQGISGGFNSSSISFSEDDNAGNGGEISISANGGNIKIKNSGDFSRLFAASIAQNNGDAGNGGNISIETDNGNITIINSSVSSGLVSSSESRTGSPGNGGSISIEANNGNIEITNSGRRAQVYSGSLSLERNTNPGNGGSIAIEVNNGNIAITNSGERASLNSSSSTNNNGNSGNGGSIAIEANNGNIAITNSGERASLNSSSSTNNGNSGSGGSIAIEANSGNVTITNSDEVARLASFSSSEKGNAGNGGSISIEADSGNITIMNSSESTALDSFSTSTEGNAGNGGNISIEADSGSIAITNRGDSSGLNSISSSLEKDAGNGGDISIEADSGSIAIRGGPLISSSASLRGNAGNGGDISLVTDTGDIIITADDDAVSGLISASTSPVSIFSRGDAGNISLLATDGIVVGQNILIFATSTGTDEDLPGAGGDVTIHGNTISGLEISTFTIAGKSGTVVIKGFGDSLTIHDLSLATTAKIEIPNLFENPDVIGDETIVVEAENIGQSGNTFITSAGDLTFNNVQIQSDANGSQPAGDVRISSPGKVRLNNSEIRSNTNGIGGGGNITFTEADSLIFNNTTTATDTAGQGLAGSIFVQDIGVFLLRNNSLLLTDASGSENGGNINIINPDGFVIAVPSENNDIIANAIDGDGGTVTIRTSRLLGFTEQREFIETRELRDNGNSDISASSRSGEPGTIDTTNLAPDPNQGLLELPRISPTPPVQRGCSAAALGTSSFTVTGRGGLPSNPTDILSRNRILTDLGPSSNISSNSETNPVDIQVSNSPEPIVEAQGLIKASDGRAFFITQANGESQDTRQSTTQCSGHIFNGL